MPDIGIAWTCSCGYRTLNTRPFCDKCGEPKPKPPKPPAKPALASAEPEVKVTFGPSFALIEDYGPVPGLTMRFIRYHDWETHISALFLLPSPMWCEFLNKWNWEVHYDKPSLETWIKNRQAGGFDVAEERYALEHWPTGAPL